jgi:hypothetical protein
MNLNRFSVANALMQSATHLELNHRDEVHKHIAAVLYKEAQALVELGLQELKLNNRHVDSSEG